MRSDSFTASMVFGQCWGLSINVKVSDTMVHREKKY